MTSLSWRNAAETAASRRTATRSAATKPGARSAQQLGAGAQVGEGEAQLAVDELGGAQARVDGLGRGCRRHERESRGGDGVAQRVEHERGKGWRGRGREQGLDVGDDQDRAPSGPGLRAGARDRVVHPLRRSAGLQRRGAGGGHLDAARAHRGGRAAGHRELADPLGAHDQHAEPRRAAEAFQQLRAFERELEPLDEPMRGGGVADEVLARDDRWSGEPGRPDVVRGTRHRGGIGPGGTSQACRGPAFPPDDRARPHGDRAFRLYRRHDEQLAGPARPERARDPLPDRGGVGTGHGLDIAGQQRHGVPPRDDLAQQRHPHDLGTERGAGQRRPGEPHDPRGLHPAGRDDHRGAVGKARVGERDVIERRLPRGPVGGGDEGGRHPRAGQRDGVPRPQPQGVDDLGMQPDDAAARVDGGRGEPGDERDLGSHPPNLDGRPANPTSHRGPHPDPERRTRSAATGAGQRRRARRRPRRRRLRG